MKTSKAKIAEIVLGRLEKFSDDSNQDHRDIYETIDSALSSVVRNRYFQEKNADVAHLDGGLLYTFKNVTVNKDEDRGEHYSELPSSTISLPYGEGIHSVSSPQSQSEPFRQVPAGFMGLFNDLASVKLEKGVGYYQENDKIYYVTQEPENLPNKVLLKMHLPLEGIGEFDVINIPSDILDQVVETTVQRWSAAAQNPTDENNDNVDTV